MKNLIKLVIVMTLFSNLAWANKMTPMQKARLGTPSIPMPESEENHVQETVLDTDFNDAEILEKEVAFYGRDGLMCAANFKLVIKVIDEKQVKTKRCVKLISPEQINKNFNLEDSRRYENSKQNLFLDLQKGERLIQEAKQV